MMAIENDIRKLEELFKENSKKWENFDDSHYRTELVVEQLKATKQIAFKYDFKWQYDEKTTKEDAIRYDEWWKDQIFDKNDFDNNNVDYKNYGIADSVSFDFYTDLKNYLKNL